MDRGDLHAKLDIILNGIEDLADKADDGLEKIKAKAAEVLDAADKDKYKVQLDAENAVTDAQRAACRGAAWLKDKLTDAQIKADDIQDKLEQAKAKQDKAAVELYTEALEAYASDMLAVAQEASDEATDAVQKALAARKDFKAKFGA